MLPDLYVWEDHTRLAQPAAHDARRKAVENAPLPVGRFLLIALDLCSAVIFCYLGFRYLRQAEPPLDSLLIGGVSTLETVGNDAILTCFFDNQIAL